MGRNKNRGKKRNQAGKSRNKSKKTHRNDGLDDWEKWLDNWEKWLDVAEYIPVVEKYVAKLRPDPVEQQLRAIADSVEDIAPHLVDQLDYLVELCDTVSTINASVSTQTKLLKEVKDALKIFHSAEIFGQFTAITLLTEAVNDIKRLADATEQMSGSLKGIETNLSSINLGGDYFPGRVHAYVRQEIQTYASSDVPHYFTVFHQGTVWWPAFADLDRSDPLGPSFLGCKSDLDELCAFLADHVRPRVGPEAVLHILMPTIGQVALKEAVKLPDAMHPCILNGQLGESGSPFVYICLTESTDKNCLRNIGLLKPRKVWVSQYFVGLCLPVVGQWLTFDCGVTWYIDPPLKWWTTVTAIVVAGGCYCCGPEPARILGRPVEPGSRPWYTPQ